MAKSIDSHEHKIKTYLLCGNKITQEEARKLFGCWRLAAVIHKLRKQDYYIKTIKEPNKHNKGYHAKYHIIKEAECQN